MHRDDPPEWQKKRLCRFVQYPDYRIERVRIDPAYERAYYYEPIGNREDVIQYDG